MSNSESPEDKQERPYDPAPAADDKSRGQEVAAPTDGPFEAPAKEFVPGPYYMGVEELDPEMDERPEAKDEDDGTNYSVDRRDFMKLFSASTVAASTACVRRPVEKAIPYVNQPTDQTPGVPTYYATTCGECASGCGVMVQTREGRPRKLEGLPEHRVSRGSLCAVGQASLQGLYHPERRDGPQIQFGRTPESVGWEALYEHLGAKLKNTSKVGIFTGGSTGHRHAFYVDFLKQLGADETKLYTYEPNILMESIAAAHKEAYGVDGMPRADLEKAQMVVGIGADFLDVGTSTVYHTQTYTDSQAYNAGQMGHHIQLEPALTLTGSRADERHVIAPKTETLTTLLLVKALYEHPHSKGSSTARTKIKTALDNSSSLLDGGYERVGVDEKAFKKLAEQLLAQENSVVLCGGSHTFDENATQLQLAGIMANELLGAYDSVLHLKEGWMPAPVRVGDFKRFYEEAADLDVLFVIEANPAFTLPDSWNFAELVADIPTVVSIQSFPTETDKWAMNRMPAHHYLEAWGDEQPFAGYWSPRQPAVRPITNSRQAEDMLLWLAAAAGKPMPYSEYRKYLKERWRAVYQAAQTDKDFESFFQTSLHRGYAGSLSSRAVPSLGNIADVFSPQDPGQKGLRLLAPLSVRLGAGEHANKPVLQEVGDTLTSVAWDTFLAMHPDTARRLGVRRNDLVQVDGPHESFQAAVYPLPGLHPDAIVVPRGNGHDKDTGTIEGGVGVNPLPAFEKATDTVTGVPVTCGQQIKIARTGETYRLATLQKHNDIANRHDIVKKMSFDQAREHVDDTKDLDTVPDLYPALPQAQYRWGMSIDLTKCTGCSACMVACSLENNVPQVGREQVLMGRAMHWIRLDRYFAGEVDNPTVTIQPMLCQHCNHAPCEAVCPVFATTHDPEGINAMTYNRCIGTRYCANACPYKVRRFNWWTHKWNVMGEKPRDRNIRALNPDVTVRTRGVMEKCNFCYQRIRDAKHDASLRGDQVREGELQVACQQTCPADAIQFGDLNDETTTVHQDRQDYRAYLALNGDPSHGHYGIKTVPNVNYLAEVTHGGSEDGHGKAKDHS